MKQPYNFYIPSLEAVATFNEFTIGQYKNIIIKHNNKPFLNIGFNTALIEALQKNNINNILFTGFDKYIIAYQLRCCIFEKEIKQKEVKHPIESTIKENNITILCAPLNIDYDVKYFEYINNLNKEQADELLLAEISKYTKIIQIDNKPIEKLEEKINILKTLSVDTLAKCINYIDSIKATIKNYYILNNGQLIEYGVKLLLP
jgi:hypothetical protein